MYFDSKYITQERNMKNMFILNSFRLAVKDVMRACDFYEYITGVKPVYRDGDYYLELNGMSILFYDYQKYKDEVVYGDNCLISFEIDNIFNLKSKLETMNIQIVFPLMQIGSNYVMEFKDLEGNDIEVYSKYEMDSESYRFY